MTKASKRWAAVQWKTCLAGSLTLVLEGCATAPSRQMTRWGTLPAPGAGAYVVSPDSSAIDPVLVAQIEQCLGNAGMKRGAKPRYLVELAYTFAPARVAIAGIDHAEPQPVATAGQLPKRRGDRETLTLVITDIADGHDLLRTTLVQRKPSAKVDGRPAITSALCNFVRPDQPA